MALSPFSATWRNDVARLLNNPGAILALIGISSGSNANGWFLRLPGGFQICLSTGLTVTNVNTASGSVFKSGNVTWTFPAAFSTSPSVAGNTNSNNAWVTADGTGTSAGVAVYLPFSFTGSLVIRMMAIGRS